MYPIKYVQGNIIAISGNHLAAGFSAGCSIPADVENKDIITGDLVLTDSNGLFPYYEYHATGNVCAGGCIGQGGSIGQVFSSERVENIFHKDIDDLKNLLRQVNISNTSCNQLFLKNCYLNAVNAYEYFMGSYLISLVLLNKEIYELFCERFKKDLEKHQNQTVAGYIEEQFFTTERNIQKYYSLIEIETPSFTDVNRCIMIRNELAHKNGHMSYHKQSAPEVFTIEYVEKAIEDIYIYIDNIVERVKKQKEY